MWRPQAHVDEHRFDAGAPVTVQPDTSERSLVRATALPFDPESPGARRLAPDWLPELEGWEMQIPSAHVFHLPGEDVGAGQTLEVGAPAGEQLLKHGYKLVGIRRLRRGEYQRVACLHRAFRWSLLSGAPIHAAPRLRAALGERQTVRAEGLAADGYSSASLSASAALFAGSTPPTITAGAVLRPGS